MAFSFETDSKGYIKKRESFNLEYKQNFQLGDNLLKYIKTLVGMANNKGGQIVFGIKDSPHILLGMSNNKLSETDPKVIDIKVREYFSPDIRWQSAIQEFEGKSLAYYLLRKQRKSLWYVRKTKMTYCEKGLFTIAIEEKQKKLNIQN